MDHKDFNGIKKWKFLIPAFYLINWTLMIAGPLLFPFAYQIYCIIIIAYSTLKTMGLCLGTLVGLIKLKSTIKYLRNLSIGQQNKQKQKSDTNIAMNNQYYHAIVIPSYKEDEEVLIETINALAASPRAKEQFIIFLAMEAHQQNSDVKAQAIIEKTKNKFYFMSFTQHQVRPGQAKGKASNVSWCVEHFQQKLQNLMIDMDKIMVSVIDADSWAPKQYFEMIEKKLAQKPEIKDLNIFSAPQIYTRNHLDVPVINRTFDSMHSLVQLANLVAVKFSFPLSNYSLSYNLAKNMGWWDTCADAIGEDFHTCQKCYWKTKSPQSMNTVPIYVPFNQVSLSTGQGYCKDIIARFWQAERHTLGVNDVAYCWNMMFKARFRFVNLWLTILVTEVFAMAAFIPWALLGLSIQYKLMNDQTIKYFHPALIEFLLNSATLFTFISYIFYEWWRRVANSEIYHQKNDAWWRVFQYPIFFTFALFGFSIPSFIMASFAVLCMTTEYRVAEKHIEKKKSCEQNNVQEIVIKKLKTLQKKLTAQKKNTIQKKNSLLKKNSLRSHELYPHKNNKIANQNLDPNAIHLDKIQKSSSELLSTTDKSKSSSTDEERRVEKVVQNSSQQIDERRTRIEYVQEQQVDSQNDDYDQDGQQTS